MTTATAAADTSTEAHRRLNRLTGEWVIVSPQRTSRPWSGATADGCHAPAPTHDPDCYLCPGNRRANGSTNPNYEATFVFDNDFAALQPAERLRNDSSYFFEHEPAMGECRVVCFSPDHSQTLAAMDVEQLVSVIDLWRAQTTELEQQYEYVQVFETRGEICGASNPHPHGQIWASQFVPDEPAKESWHQRDYLRSHGNHLLLDYVEEEIRAKDRLVLSNEHWAVIVPYWAYWPFETIVLPRRRVASLSGLGFDDTQALASILKAMLTGFDRLFATPFPYCSGWHSAPRSEPDAWQLHAHYYPPLLRSATVAKIPASYELLAGLQRDLTAESAAARLRDVMAAE